MNDIKNRTLYFGDNLDILREKFPNNENGYFDLVYLDPPFNSKRNYNVLYSDKGEDSPAQVHAFEDSWIWGSESEKIFDELTGKVDSKTEISDEIMNTMEGFEKIIKKNNMLAYLTMMTIRLIELKKVIKPTGSIYLHCDSHASHYLKIIMDKIFGYNNFRNEIIWRRTTKIKGTANDYGNVNDIILFYTKTNNFTFNKELHELSDINIKRDYKNIEKETGRLYNHGGMFLPGNSPKTLYFKDKNIKITAPDGKRFRWSQETYNDEFLKNNLCIHWNNNGIPRYKIYLDEHKGIPITNIWSDIEELSTMSSERLGYSTQKPEALLERIIKASSNEGDWVLDPFSGCGTTVSVAERLNRNWIGIDITSLGINLIKHRIDRQFKNKKISVYVDGLPKDIHGAKTLADKDKFEFQYWILDMIGALPLQSKGKKGADGGIDGIYRFKELGKNDDIIIKKLIVSVKGGGIGVKDIRDLGHVINREKVEGGLFITLNTPTRDMITEASKMGTFKSNLFGKSVPRLQILTVQDIFDGKKPELPSSTEQVEYYKEALSIPRKEFNRPNKIKQKQLSTLTEL